jgi:hypothetical protein
MSNIEILLVFFTPGVGHTHLIIDATPILADGADEEAALNWAGEKFANEREIISADMGTPEYIRARIASVFHYSVQVSE